MADRRMHSTRNRASLSLTFGGAFCVWRPAVCRGFANNFSDEFSKSRQASKTQRKTHFSAFAILESEIPDAMPPDGSFGFQAFIRL
jgi:hypothetical protein